MKSIRKSMVKFAQNDYNPAEMQSILPNKYKADLVKWDQRLTSDIDFYRKTVVYLPMSQPIFLNCTLMVNYSNFYYSTNTFAHSEEFQQTQTITDQCCSELSWTKCWKIIILMGHTQSILFETLLSWSVCYMVINTKIPKFPLSLKVLTRTQHFLIPLPLSSEIYHFLFPPCPISPELIPIGV